MTGSTFSRLVWKEYRLQRAFWISMVVLAGLFFAAVLVFTSERHSAIRAIWLFDVAFALSALYALGCGATLFAAEHETGTYEFQRALPVSGLRFFAGKVTFGVVSTAAMTGVLWGAAAVLARGQWADAQTHRQLWALWGLGAAGALVWGTFFSLLVKRPLVAAILAGVVGSLITILSAPLVLARGWHYHHDPYLYSVPYQASFLAIVALATVWLGHRWFREKVVSARRGGPDGKLTGRSAAALCQLAPPSRRVFGRLVWQHLRQSAVMLAVLSALVVPLLLTGIGACIGAWTRANLPPPEGWGVEWSIFVSLNAVVVVPIAGGCVFLGDQRRRGFRFLAEQGLEPGRIWLSRQAVWGGAVLGWVVLTLPFFLAAMMPQRASIQDVALATGCVLGLVILAYSAGQLCSMLFSSGILAGVISVVLAAVLFFWVGLMGFLDVPWLWSVAPIPLVLLLATRLRTPHWLLERNTLKGWRATVLTLAVPLVVILTSVCAYRVYSVPRVDLGFEPAEFTRLAAAEDRATAEMYRRALDLYVGPSREATDDGGWSVPSFRPDRPLGSAEITWLEKNEGTLRLVLEATERPSCDFFDPTGRLSMGRPGAGFDDLGRLLAASARRLESEGDLDAAFERCAAALRFSAHLRERTASPGVADTVERIVFDCLPFWAAHADQTVERIKAAIARLEKLGRGLSSPSDAIKSDYVLVEQIVSGKADVDEALGGPLGRSPNDAFVLYAISGLPWEKARVRRVMSLFTASELKLIDDVEQALEADRPPPIPDDHTFEPDWHRLKRTTPLVNAFHSGATLYHSTSQGGNSYRVARSRGHYLACELARIETRRRAVRLQLALAGWRIEHGRLPDRLRELEGPFFKAMPLDPYSARPFEYVPQGKEDPIFDRGPSFTGTTGKTLVSEGEPFFQSAGLKQRLKSGSDRDFVFRIPWED